ncbi:MAG: ion transporter [Lachnospiraceae bacterium]|nr:ion transporter [Lachnospiraceae bacterium]
MRKRLYEIIEVAKEGDIWSNIYDFFMLITICISIVPLAFKQQSSFSLWIDRITVCIYILDYMLRLITADYKLNKHGIAPFLQYPFTPMAIIDLISILPSISTLNNGFRLFKTFRLIRTLRIFRIFKVMRYSKSVSMFISVFKKQKESLLTICGITVAYIIITALIIINIEPESFETFFEAIYWATVSLTTVGYGDIYPVSTAGRVITMISSIFGIAIVAMPAGIITAGFMDELSKDK